MKKLLVISLLLITVIIIHSQEAKYILAVPETEFNKYEIEAEKCKLINKYLIRFLRADNRIQIAQTQQWDKILSDLNITNYHMITEELAKKIYSASAINYIIASAVTKKDDSLFLELKIINIQSRQPEKIIPARLDNGESLERIVYQQVQFVLSYILSLKEVTKIIDISGAHTQNFFIPRESKSADYLYASLFPAFSFAFLVDDQEAEVFAPAIFFNLNGEYSFLNLYSFSFPLAFEILFLYHDFSAISSKYMTVLGITGGINVTYSFSIPLTIHLAIRGGATMTFIKGNIEDMPPSGDGLLAVALEGRYLLAGHYGLGLKVSLLRTFYETPITEYQAGLTIGYQF